MNILSKLKYLLLIPIAVLIIWVLSWCISDIYSSKALKYEQQWANTGFVNSQKEWDSVVAWSRLSITFNPYNPNHHETLGRLHFWRFFIEESPITSDQQAQFIVNAGLVSLRKAIEMRPTWPVAWASLLQLKSIGRQIDYEFDQVWDRSVELGDWESKVQTILLESGLINWQRFNEFQRERTINIFVAMTSKPYSELTAIRVVDRLGAWPLVCNVLVDPIITPYRMQLACSRMLSQEVEAQDEDEGVPPFLLSR